MDTTVVNFHQDAGKTSIVVAGNSVIAVVGTLCTVTVPFTEIERALLMDIYSGRITHEQGLETAEALESVVASIRNLIAEDYTITHRDE